MNELFLKEKYLKESVFQWPMMLGQIFIVYQSQDHTQHEEKKECNKWSRSFQQRWKKTYPLL